MALQVEHVNDHFSQLDDIVSSEDKIQWVTIIIVLISNFVKISYKGFIAQVDLAAMLSNLL